MRSTILLFTCYGRMRVFFFFFNKFSWISFLFLVHVFLNDFLIQYFFSILSSFFTSIQCIISEMIDYFGLKVVLLYEMMHLYRHVGINADWNVNSRVALFFILTSYCYSYIPFLIEFFKNCYISLRINQFNFIYPLLSSISKIRLWF